MGEKKEKRKEKKRKEGKWVTVDGDLISDGRGRCW